MAQEQTFGYIDGKIVEQSKIGLPIDDLGFQRGYGVFDFMRTYNNELFKPWAHLARFRRSADALHLEIALDDQQLLDTCQHLLGKSSLTHPAVKLIVTGGSGSAAHPYMQPRLIILAQNYPVYESTCYEDGVRLALVQYQRELPEVKSLNYMNTLRLEQWKRKVQSYDLLYHHSQWGITESPRANIFAVINNTLITPSNHILKGITRSIVIELAEPHYDIEERGIELSEMLQADEAFICSTSKRIIPVTHLNEQSLGDGKPGPVTRHVMDLFDQYTNPD